MANKKWIWIGCGGCFSVIAVLVILLIIGGWWIKNYTNRIQQNYEELSAKHDQLNQEYPFTPPGDKSIDPDRFDKYLSVRDQVITKVETNLDWLIKLANSPDIKGGMSIFGLISKFVGLPMTLINIDTSRVQLLEAVQMSSKEYEYLTRVTAAEILSWRELEEDNQYKQLAEKYIQPLEDINEHVAEIEQNNPSQNIELGPFDLEQFMEAVEQGKDPEHTNRELIQENAERIISSDSVVFVDACFIQSLNFD